MFNKIPVCKFNFFAKFYGIPVLLIAIVIFALILRISLIFLFYPIHVPPSNDKSGSFNFIMPDELEYFAFTQKLMTAPGFSPPDFGGYVIRVPLAPLFFAFFFWLFGLRLWPIFLMQSILDVGILMIIYLICRKIFKTEGLSLLAVFIYSINSLTICYSNLLLPEIIFTFLVTLTVWLFLSFLENQRLFYFIGLGILTGLAALTKPLGLYLPLVLLAGLFIARWFNLIKKTELSRMGWGVVVLIVVHFIVLSPWQYLNWQSYGRYSLTNQMGINLLSCNASRLKAELEKIPVAEAFEKLAGNLLKEKFENPFIKEQAYKKVALSYVSKHLVACAYYHLEGMTKIFTQESIWSKMLFRFLFNKYKLNSILPYKSFFHLLIVNSFLGNLFFVIGTLAMYLRKNTRFYSFFFSVFILYFLLLSGNLAAARFKVPFLPLMIISTTYGIWEFLRWLKKTV